HLDAETLIPLLRANPKMELVIPEANREFVVDRLKTPIEMPRGLDAGQFTTAGGFKIHAVPAAHERLEKDANGRHKFLGYVVEFNTATPDEFVTGCKHLDQLHHVLRAGERWSSAELK